MYRHPFFSGSIQFAFAAILLLPFLCSCGENKSVAASEKPNENSYSVTVARKGTGLISLSPEAEKVAGVKIEAVGKHCVDELVKTTGEVLADANLVSHINSPVSGRVTEVLAVPGQHMEQGKAVLKIRSPEIEDAEAQLLQQDAEIKADLKKDLLQIDSDIATAKAELSLAEKVYARTEHLVNEKIASRADCERAQTQKEKDSIQLNALQQKRDATIVLSKDKLKLVTEPIKQRLRLMGVPDDEIKHILSSRMIEAVVPVYAPETGIICERRVNVGELVDTQKDLLTIGDFHTVWPKADVYEKDIAKLKAGQHIDLDVDSFPGEKFHGKLDYMADSVNPDTRTLTVRAEVQNPGDKLKPKMFARMSILVGHKSVLTVPNSAVQDAGSSKVVYVAQSPGKYSERKVELGKSCKDFCEVMSGLKQGERIAVAGTFELRSQSMSQSDQD